MHNGIPFDIAFGMKDGERFPDDDIYRDWMSIQFSVFAGSKFDIDSLEFIDEDNT